MSRWLVGSSRNKEILRLDMELCERQSRPLAAGEAAHDTQRVVAPESEIARGTASAVDGKIAADAPHVVDRGECEAPRPQGAGRSTPLANSSPASRRLRPRVRRAPRGALATCSCRCRWGRRCLCAPRVVRGGQRQRRARGRRVRHPALSLRGRCRPCARDGANRKATRSAAAQASSGRSSRSSLSSIFRRLCACFVFCPAMFLRMNSSVFRTSPSCRSTSARPQARSSSRKAT